MNEKIKAIGILPDGTTRIIKQFCGHSLRYTMLFILIDNLDNAKEELRLACGMSDTDYLAVNICCEETEEIIKKIVEVYEPKA